MPGRLGALMSTPPALLSPAATCTYPAKTARLDAARDRESGAVIVAVLATAARSTLRSLPTGPRWLLAAPLTQTGGRAHRPGAGGTGAALCLELAFFFFFFPPKAEHTEHSVLAVVQRWLQETCEEGVGLKRGGWPSVPSHPLISNHCPRLRFILMKWGEIPGSRKN